MQQLWNWQSCWDLQICNGHTDLQWAITHSVWNCKNRCLNERVGDSLSRGPDKWGIKATYKYLGSEVSFTNLLETNENGNNSLPDRQHNNSIVFIENRGSKKQGGDRFDQGNLASQLLRSTYPVLWMWKQILSHGTPGTTLNGNFFQNFSTKYAK